MTASFLVRVFSEIKNPISILYVNIFITKYKMEAGEEDLFFILLIVIVAG